MSKVSSNVKKIGIKSIHYSGDNIILEDSFSKDIDVIYDLKYDDIDSLNKAIRISKKNVNHIANVKDLENEAGFVVNAKVNNKNLDARINRVKNISYLHKKIDLPYDDNFNIQIYNNLLDINKIIISYCNHVLYSLNDFSRERYLNPNEIFDEIGMIPYTRSYYNLIDNDKKRVIDEKLIPLIQTMIDNYKIIDVSKVKFKCGDKQKEKEKTKKLKQDKIKQFSYDYIRTISALRNIMVHNYSINLSDLSDLIDLAKRDIDSYINDLTKNNSKYFLIIKELYGAKAVEEFLDYMIYDRGKNIGVSIERITKIILEEEDHNSNPEFYTKYKTILKFDIYRKFLNDSEEYVKRLKTCDDKDVLYENFANEYRKKTDLFKLRKVIKEKLGNVKNKYFIDNEIKEEFKSEIGNLKVGFYGLVYMMSKCLTKKESNDLFSRIITKLNSVHSLVKLASNNGVAIDSKLVKYNHLYDFNDFKNYEMIIEQLTILKCLCCKRKTESTNTIIDEKAYVIFKNGGVDKKMFTEALDKAEGNNKMSKKPFKNFIRNSVIKSKSFQYLSRYMNPIHCIDIINNDAIVNYVLDDMYGDKNSNDVKLYPLKRYLSRVYYKFLLEKENDDIISYSQLETIKGHLKDLTLKTLIDSTFQKSKYNYSALVNLYLNICYLVVKNIMNMNSTYFIQIQEYSILHNLISKEYKVKYNLDILKDYMNNMNKNTRYYKQLNTLINKDYIKNVNPKQYEYILTKYRNIVEHTTILSGEDCFNFKIDKLNSYFAIYQIIVQNKLDNEVRATWGEDSKKYFDKSKKGYSTELVIALNLPYAYSSRFNNVTIEKYAIKAKNN